MSYTGCVHVCGEPYKLWLVCADPRTAKCPQALVLAPTRELAQQILAVASEAGGHVNARYLHVSAPAAQPSALTHTLVASLLGQLHLLKLHSASYDANAEPCPCTGTSLQQSCQMAVQPVLGPSACALLGSRVAASIQAAAVQRPCGWQVLPGCGGPAQARAGCRAEAGRGHCCGHSGALAGPCGRQHLQACPHRHGCQLASWQQGPQNSWSASACSRLMLLRPG